MDTQKIQALAENVIDQIAAGEVVEKPAHLVKELIENSLDAGATELELEVGDGGTSVRVSDNGAGIAAGQLSVALDRHTTSKIRLAEDLWRLSTFGFRGEALASISAVSELSLSSRPAGQENGARLVTKFGKKGEVEEVGQPPGTTIRVRGLYENIPARKKFMKSAASEIAAIRQVLKALALGNPGCSFKFTVESKLDLFYPRAESLLARAQLVLETKDLYRHVTDDGVNACEVIFGNPRDAQKNSRNMWFLCQGRWIQDRTLIAASMEGFRGMLMHGEYPQVVVSLRLDPELVDVNIHPTKSQVKFSDSSAIFRLVSRTFKEGLDEAPWNAGARASVQAATESFAARAGEAPLAPQAQFLAPNTGTTRAWDQVSFKKKMPNGMDRVLPGTATAFPAPAGAPSATVVPGAGGASRDDGAHGALSGDAPDLTVDHENQPITEAYWSTFQVLSQAHLTYLVCQNQAGIVLVDQHAAHERVLYERVLGRWTTGRGETQEFLFPLSVDLSAERVEAVLTQAEGLARLGVRVEQLGPSTLGVFSAPAFLKDSFFPEALDQLAHEVLDHGASFVFEKFLAEFAATLACHSAIRAGQALSGAEMEALLRMMDEAPRSSFCPHGRPVSINYSLAEIERDFGRTV